ncbi:hypothetical protein [Paenibacillus chitinolyticus]|uniref:Uncharacterized protein n=1 Tax=Paenibacillus chitinolyticus TaxID=79263 RepID=A0ABT4FNN5_9BACL|nr:hypothetical protein [Paenibacillus chitinolyticus]MCY9590825.1 hypothetical protein [Paenibacillus chitinolyticus]MCY9598732.1 hypothetical protein [Paenibacillus chitinolyticus]
MSLYADMFISKWHLITLGLILIAWIALIAGGYDKRTILRSGGGAVLLLYIVSTIPIATITHGAHKIDESMRSELDRHYQERMSKSEVREDIDRLAVAAGAFSDDDSYDIRVYAGNYSSAYTFRGSLTFTTYDAQGQVVHEKSYDNVIIAPGEKKSSTTTTRRTHSLHTGIPLPPGRRPGSPDSRVIFWREGLLPASCFTGWRKGKQRQKKNKACPGFKTRACFV